MTTIAEKLEAYSKAVTPEELGALWGYSTFTICQWIRAKRLPAFKLGNQWRVDPAEALKFWLDRSTGT
jgi:excisionase family DNA binding protein